MRSTRRPRAAAAPPRCAAPRPCPAAGHSGGGSEGFPLGETSRGRFVTPAGTRLYPVLTCTRTPRTFGISPSFRGHFLSPRAQPYRYDSHPSASLYVLRQLVGSSHHAPLLDRSTPHPSRHAHRVADPHPSASRAPRTCATSCSRRSSMGHSPCGDWHESESYLRHQLQQALLHGAQPVRRLARE